MKKMVSLLFHRGVIVGIFIIIQIMVLVVMLLGFNTYFLPIYIFCTALSVFAVFWIVGRQSDPGYKIAWIVPILLFPIFGGLFYLMFGRNELSKRIQNDMAAIQKKAATVLEPNPDIQQQLKAEQEAMY